MKKFFYSFLLLFVFYNFSLYGQDFAQKGVWEAGGMIGFSSTTAVSDGETGDEALTQFTFEPYIGYFVINGLELGLIPSFSSLSQGDASISSFNIFFAPAWNFDLQSKAFPYLEGRIGYGTSTYDSGEGDDQTLSGLSWGVRGGLKYQLGSSALVNASLGYTQITLNPKDWDGGRNGTNVFDVMVGFTVFFGK
ncbi:MAG: outer membrane beta-barrel protein [Ignavibacteriaceae bacterium]